MASAASLIVAKSGLNCDLRSINAVLRFLTASSRASLASATSRLASAMASNGMTLPSFDSAAGLASSPFVASCSTSLVVVSFALSSVFGFSGVPFLLSSSNISAPPHVLLKIRLDSNLLYPIDANAFHIGEIASVFRRNVTSSHKHGKGMRRDSRRAT